MVIQDRDTLRDTVMQNAVTKIVESEQHKRELVNLKSTLRENSDLKAASDEKDLKLSQAEAERRKLQDRMEQVQLSYVKTQDTADRLRSDVSTTTS